MSDELIEGHALRGQQPEPETESPKSSRSSTSARKNVPPRDEPTGPYIILEPPPEAGDVLSHQSEMSTFHKGLQPIVIEETASKTAHPVDPPGEEPASSDDLSLSDDLPWSVIESASPDLFAGKQPGSQSRTEGATEPPSDFLPHFHTPTGTFAPIEDGPLTGPEAEGQMPTTAGSNAEPPPDFLPHFHTPTGTFPPVREELLPPQRDEEVAPTAAKPDTSPPDFLPHFHTPTGIFPRVGDDLSPATEEPEEPESMAYDREAASAELSPDFLPSYRTPEGIFPPVGDDLESEAPAPTVPERGVPPAEPPPDFLPSYRTPAGIFPPVKDDLESEAPAPTVPEPRVPPAELSPDFLPSYRTPAGVFPPVTDDRPPTSKRERARDIEVRPEPLPVAPPPELGEPVPVIHFQEGFHPSEEVEEVEDVAGIDDIEDEALPPVAPISEESSEFIPLFHTPTSVLPPVPDEAPIMQPGSVDISEGETGDEVIDAEWVVDVDRRLHRARRKLQATANKATSSEQKMKSRLLTALAVVIITVLAVIIPSAFSFLAGGANQPPGSGEASTQAAGGAAPGDDQTPGVPLLLTPTQTLPPLYSQGWLAYSSNRDGDFEIYKLDMRSGQLDRMTDNPAADRSPKWSPDGRQLVFVSDRSGNDDLYLVSAGGGEPVKLTSNAGSDRNPTWAPDGSRIVFSRETVDGSHLMSMPSPCLSEPETCEDQSSALTPGGYDLFPDWSPDGRWVAFAASDFPGLPSAIALINPEGDGYNALAGTGTSDFYPAWSPDGNRIAFVSYAQGDYDLWVMGANGKGLFQLTQNEATDVEPAWSPDGNYIIFASDRSAEGDFELFLIRSDCTSPQMECESSIIQLTNDSADDLNPDWIR